MSRLRRLADRALAVGAMLGLAALLLTALAAATGVRPLFFRSGSMAPTIGTGSLALARHVQASDLRVGDVVSVRTSSGNRVSHRVAALDRSAGEARLTLKGDGNRGPDPESYVVGSAYRVFWHVPWVGYALGAIVSPFALLGFGGAVAGLLLIAGRRDDRASRTRRRHAGRRAPRRRGRRVAATVVTTAAVLGGPSGPAAAAPWTDGVVVGGAVLTAATVPPPATFTCSPSIGSTNFSWTAVAGATNYTFHYGSGGSQTSTVAGTSTSVSGLISGGTAWVVANRVFPSITWTSSPSQTRTYTNLLFVLGSCS